MRKDIETNEESEWIMNLADTLKKHRDEYLTNGNRYYRPSIRKTGKDLNCNGGDV